MARLVSPTLTTMQVNKVNMGQVAVQTLINRMKTPEAPAMSIALHTRLIERQSVIDNR